VPSVFHIFNQPPSAALVPVAFSMGSGIKAVTAPLATFPRSAVRVYLGLPRFRGEVRSWEAGLKPQALRSAHEVAALGGTLDEAEVMGRAGRVTPQSGSGPQSGQAMSGTIGAVLDRVEQAQQRSTL
jgi:hypothetical protein